MKLGEMVHKMTNVVILIVRTMSHVYELCPKSPSRLLDVTEVMCFVADLAGRQTVCAKLLHKASCY